MAERLEKQIRDNYLRAMDSLLEQSLIDNDFDWVVRLYDELRRRIAQQIPTRVDLHQEISENMDVDIFRQCLEHGAFSGEDLHRLIAYVFSWFERLQAPARDRETAAKKAEVLAAMSSGRTFGQIVPLFLRACHTILDQIEADAAAFRARRGRSSAEKTNGLG